MKTTSNFNIRFLLTGKCTAICSYCHNEGQSKQAKLLKLEEIKKIIEKMEIESDLPVEVILSGGEPTLHNKVKEIAQFLKSKGIYVSMDSHAGHSNLLKPILPYLDELKIHLDSFDSNKQFLSMGIKLENIIHSISIAKKYPIKIIINHPVKEKNETIKFIRAARKISIDCKLIELFGEENKITLKDINFEDLGYVLSYDGSYHHYENKHKIYTKYCDRLNNKNNKTLFIGSEGVRNFLDENEFLFNNINNLETKNHQLKQVSRP